MEAASEVRSAGRWARLAERRHRQRRLVAALMAVVGLSAIVAALAFQPESGTAPSSSSRTAGSPADPSSPEGGEVGKPPSTAPGGVGTDPEATGLPAVPAEGGAVRTGTEEEGCFSSMAEYLEEWHRTEKEPDPCFVKQPASNQEQPEGVRRTYNGERF